jgi:hypothetical protein
MTNREREIRARLFERGHRVLGYDNVSSDCAVTETTLNNAPNHRGWRVLKIIDLTEQVVQDDCQIFRWE